MNRPLDPRLYLVTDRDLSFHMSLEDVISCAVRGGVTIIQLREKNCSTRDYIELALRVRQILAPFNIPLIINDRVDVALAVNAEGVHVGQSDMPFREARRIMGPEAIIGLSVETMEQALQAEDLDVDYLGVSPVFFTPTKTDTKSEWGLMGLKALRKRSRHKLVAIGGINKFNAEVVLNAGADGLAVVSAICSSPNPEEASRELISIINKNRETERKI
jgi:thiamine-phosphate pyrophosphorylase